MKRILAPNRPAPTAGKLTVLGGSDGHGWDVETVESATAMPVLVGRFNSLGDAKLFVAAGELLTACEAAMADGFLAGEALDLVSAAIAKARGQ